MSTRILIDPAGLREHATRLRGEAEEELAAGSGLYSRSLPRMPSSVLAHVSGAICDANSGLSALASALQEDARALDRCAHWAELADRAGISPTGPEFALLFAMLSAWSDRHAEFQALDMRLHNLIAGEETPQQVNDFFESLSSLEQIYLAQAFPGLVGSLNGVPFELRYTANRFGMMEAIPALETEAAELIARMNALRMSAASTSSIVLAGAASRIADRLEQIEWMLEYLPTWIQERRQFLLFDPSGDGKVAEVIGDLDAADDVALFVPGMTNDVTDFEAFRQRGLTLQS